VIALGSIFPSDLRRAGYGIFAVASEHTNLRPKSDAVVLAVAHAAYQTSGWDLITRLLKNGRGLVMDVKGLLNRNDKPDGIELWRL
jgi:hypothetical protein